MYYMVKLSTIYIYLPTLKFLSGIVPSSVVLTSFQVMSRVFLIWAVTHSVKEVSVYID